MSGKKQSDDLERRAADVAREINARAAEKTEFVVNEIARRLYLRPTTIWNDYKRAKQESNELKAKNSY